MSVHELTTEQVASSEDAEVEHFSRVSLEDFTQSQTQGYDSSMISDTVQPDSFVASYQDCPDFNDILIMVHLIRNVVVWYDEKVLMTLMIPGFFGNMLPWSLLPSMSKF